MILVVRAAILVFSTKSSVVAIAGVTDKMLFAQ